MTISTAPLMTKKEERLTKRIKELEEKGKEANEFIRDIAKLLPGSDGLGSDGLSWSIDDFESAIIGNATGGRPEKLWDRFEKWAGHFGYSGANLELAKSAYHAGFTNLKNIQHEEKTEAIQNGGWYCDTCKKIIEPVNVTFEETCELCGSDLN